MPHLKETIFFPLPNFCHPIGLCLMLHSRELFFKIHIISLSPKSLYIALHNPCPTLIILCLLKYILECQQIYLSLNEPQVIEKGDMFCFHVR